MGSLTVTLQVLSVAVLHGQDGQRVEIVFEVALLLPAIGIQVLAEISLLIEQAHADQRQIEIARRFHVVAGKHAQAAGIDGQAFGEAVFGGEVGDRACRLPGLRPILHVRVVALAGLRVLGQIARVGGGALQRCLRNPPSMTTGL